MGEFPSPLSFVAGLFRSLLVFASALVSTSTANSLWPVLQHWWQMPPRRLRFPWRGWYLSPLCICPFPVFLLFPIPSSSSPCTGATKPSCSASRLNSFRWIATLLDFLGNRQRMLPRATCRDLIEVEDVASKAPLRQFGLGTRSHFFASVADSVGSLDVKRGTNIWLIRRTGYRRRFCLQQNLPSLQSVTVFG